MPGASTAPVERLIPWSPGIEKPLQYREVGKPMGKPMGKLQLIIFIFSDPRKLPQAVQAAETHGFLSRIGMGYKIKKWG